MPNETILERRATPRQARARERVESILVAARDIIEHEGVEPLSTQRIAKVAGIPVGSVYQFFPNKHSIVLELAKRSLIPMNELVDRTSPAPATDEQWWPWWETFIDGLIDEPALTKERINEHAEHIVEFFRSALVPSDGS